MPSPSDPQWLGCPAHQTSQNIRVRLATPFLQRVVVDDDVSMAGKEIVLVFASIKKNKAYGTLDATVVYVPKRSPT